jgi:hypothetical protein
VDKNTCPSNHKHAYQFIKQQEEREKKKIPPIENAAYLEIQVKYYWGCEF